jgi:small-conductance mechanosensitive channel
MVSSGLIVGGIHLLFIKQEDYNDERKFLVEKKALNLIRGVVLIWWLYYFLGILDLRDPISLWFGDFLTESYGFGSVKFTLQEILQFIIVLVLSFAISNFISMIVDGGALAFLKLPKGIPAAISLVIRYFIVSFGFVLAISALGIDLSSFNLMAGALGLGIGFGLQTIISNFVSGIILVFERPILPGDTVEVQNLMGKVTNIGVRSSRVRTFDGAEVVVPNNNLIANDLINWTLSDSVKRIEILIGTAYGSDPNIVLKILQDEALKNEFTLDDPAPIAFFKEFGESSLNFRLLVWVPFDKGLISKSNISVGIYNSFKVHGIEIPFPQRDVHVKDIAEKKNEPKKQNKVTKQSNDTESDESDKNK